MPGPIIGGWLSDRLGRKPLIVAVYLGGAAALVLFVAAGSDTLLLVWISIGFLSIFNFVESPQLQSLLADISRPGVRDASFSVYFTLAFGAGAIWVAVYGYITGVLGNTAGLPVVFGIMALAYLGAGRAGAAHPRRGAHRAGAGGRGSGHPRGQPPGLTESAPSRQVSSGSRVP